MLLNQGMAATQAGVRGYRIMAVTLGRHYVGHLLTYETQSVTQASRR